MLAAMSLDSPIRCTRCKGTFTVRALVKAASQHWAALNVTITSTPCCQAREELEIVPGKVTRGYIYAAGAPHFCGMEEHEAPGLALERRDGQTWLVWGDLARPLESVA